MYFPLLPAISQQQFVPLSHRVSFISIIEFLPLEKNGFYRFNDTIAFNILKTEEPCKASGTNDVEHQQKDKEKNDL